MSARLCAVLLVAAAAAVVAVPLFDTEIDDGPYRPWESRLPSYSDGDSVMDFFSETLLKAREMAQEVNIPLEPFTDGGAKKTILPDKYFSFLPEYVASMIPGSQASWSSPCFDKNTARVDVGTDGAKISITSEKASSKMCHDFYLIMTTEGIHFHNVFLKGEHSINWRWGKKTTDADRLWVQSNGFRIFRFTGSKPELIADLLATIELFTPVILKNPAVPDFAAEANIKFIRDYANVTMEKREVDYVDVGEDFFQDGDFIGIIRLDGLDTMQVFGTGAHTGHTAMVMTIGGEKYILESTDKTSYWPKGNIQRTPIKEWLALAHAADYNVRHLPLSTEARAKFNSSAALEYFSKVEGVPYGYHNFIWGWVDTEDDNLPRPLTHEILEVLLAIVDKLEPKIGKRMWGEAFNKRLGTTDLNTAEIYQKLTEKKITFGQLISMPEKDEWVYSDGPSMVCDVFVCAMYKAGGLFGNLADDIQCTEFQNWDVETLNFFDTNPVLPDACKTADPMLPTCQLMGKYRLRLPGFGTVTPYPHMREKCAALPPNFVRPDGC